MVSLRKRARIYEGFSNAMNAMCQVLTVDVFFGSNDRWRPAFWPGYSRSQGDGLQPMGDKIVGKGWHDLPVPVLRTLRNISK